MFELEIIWFVLWGLIWAIYFVLDGFDFGMGILMPFITKTNTEKRILYNSAGPFWDANEVWLITAGGVTFAAFPKVYAYMFSALYAPLLIILFALIFRAVSYEFRAKVDSDRWRSLWDVFQFLGNLIPAFLFGVTFANLFSGIPFDEAGIYYGSITKFLNPYGFMGGLLFSLIFSYHGALWLAIKSSSELHDRSLRYAKVLWIPTTGVALLFLAMSSVYTSLYDNYIKHPVLIIIPALVIVAALASRYFLQKTRPFFAWACNGFAIFFTTFFGIAGMFPNLLISNMDPSYSLSLYNATASKMSLTIMLVTVLITIPAVLGYQAWVYYTFMHKLTEEDLKSETAY
ncbi:MAG: cytochrome d ubiquinol oxidase subunit II [Desulfovibrionaceae bacterium]